ncbi:MAG: hypothetical protein ABH821_03080 [archaeon]
MVKIITVKYNRRKIPLIQGNEIAKLEAEFHKSGPCPEKFGVNPFSLSGDAVSVKLTRIKSELEGIPVQITSLKEWVKKNKEQIKSQKNPFNKEAKNNPVVSKSKNRKDLLHESMEKDIERLKQKYAVCLSLIILYKKYLEIFDLTKEKVRIAKQINRKARSYQNLFENQVIRKKKEKEE